MSRDVIYQNIARIGHAVSNPHRLRLLNILSQGENTVERLSNLLGESIASTSAHLKVLKTACLLENRRDGKNIFYRISSSEVASFWLALRTLGEHLLPEVRELILHSESEQESLCRIEGAKLLDLVRKKKVILLDLRSPAEFAASHLPEAKSVPADQLKDWLKSAPSRKPIVVYCRGRYCVAAIKGTEQIRKSGLKATRLPYGVLEWWDKGFELQPAAPF